MQNRRWADLMLAECLEHPEVDVRLERFLELAVVHVWARLQMECDVILKDYLLRRYGDGLSQVNVRAGEASFANELCCQDRILIDANVEIHRHLHLEFAVVAARGDIGKNLVVRNGDDVVVEG